MNRDSLDYTDPAFVSTMRKLVPGTQLTAYEIHEIGVSLVSWVHVVETLGHTSPASSLDYIASGTTGISGEIVRDFVAWTSGRTNMAPGCADRLRTLLTEAEWHNRETTVTRLLEATSGAEQAS